MKRETKAPSQTAVVRPEALSDFCYKIQYPHKLSGYYLTNVTLLTRIMHLQHLINMASLSWFTTNTASYHLNTFLKNKRRQMIFDVGFHCYGKLRVSYGFFGSCSQDLLKPFKGIIRINKSYKCIFTVTNQIPTIVSQPRFHEFQRKKCILQNCQNWF